MPAVLATLDDAKKMLGIDVGDSTHDDVLQELLDELEAQLVLETGLTFGDAGAVVDEPVNGSGRNVLWLSRPATAVATVKIGRSLVEPDDELDGTDPDDVVLDPRFPRRLARPGRLVFPRGIRNVFVTYTAAAQLPSAARMALLDAVAWAFRRRGSEDATSESVGGFSHAIVNDLWAVPRWRAYVERMHKPAAM